MIDFYDQRIDCPWFDNGKCQGKVSYNQHVNDPRYGDCEESSCPILYWVNILDSSLRRIKNKLRHYAD